MPNPKKNAIEKSKNQTCGIVMPISEMAGLYSESHWVNVLEILKEALHGISYKVELVSTAEDVGVIHRRIVQNLYHKDIVICDISGRNPNVMFELGIRIAFKKPVILILDDLTVNPFDTTPMEYVKYPSSLHYQGINNFKKILQSKILGTASSIETGAHEHFLDSFGAFQQTELKTQEISTISDAFYELTLRLDSIQGQINRIANGTQNISALISPQSNIGLNYAPVKTASQMIGEVTSPTLSFMRALNEFQDNNGANIQEAINSISNAANGVAKRATEVIHNATSDRLEKLNHFLESPQIVALMDKISNLADDPKFIAAIDKIEEDADVLSKKLNEIELKNEKKGDRK